MSSGLSIASLVISVSVGSGLSGIGFTVLEFRFRVLLEFRFRSLGL